MSDNGPLVAEDVDTSLDTSLLDTSLLDTSLLDTSLLDTSPLDTSLVDTSFDNNTSFRQRQLEQIAEWRKRLQENIEKHKGESPEERQERVENIKLYFLLESVELFQ